MCRWLPCCLPLHYLKDMTCEHKKKNNLPLQETGLVQFRGEGSWPKSTIVKWTSISSEARWGKEEFSKLDQSSFRGKLCEDFPLYNCENLGYRLGTFTGDRIRQIIWEADWFSEKWEAPVNSSCLLISSSELWTSPRYADNVLLAVSDKIKCNIASLDLIKVNLIRIPAGRTESSQNNYIFGKWRRHIFSPWDLGKVSFNL